LAAQAASQEDVFMPWNNQGGGGGGGPWGSGPQGPWGSGPQSSGPQPPDLEEFLRRGQDKLRSVMPGGGLGGRGVLLIAIIALLFWVGSGIYFVQPDETGVVMRFGAYVRDATWGINYHLPYPIEAVLTPKVTRVNRIDVGMRVVEDTRRGGNEPRDVPEESLMLTGDENIVEVEFSVFWTIKPGKGASEYLFNIQSPEGTVKAVAESAMREVVGRNNLSPILTTARPEIEKAVHDLMQTTLDRYEAGVKITEVQMQRVYPPAEAAQAFREVQAARILAESAQNEAHVYANKKIPEAKGHAAQITQAAQAYREQTVAEATGQAARFLKVYEEYKKAPDVTRRRIYLETLEKVFSRTNKIILDANGAGGSGVVPYLPLNELPPRTAPATSSGTPGGSR
jgi:modulator of FtsH protease HflK